MGRGMLGISDCTYSTGSVTVGVARRTQTEARAQQKRESAAGLRFSRAPRLVW